MHTRAVYDATSDTWTINGTKTWITNGGIADIHVVVASAEPDLAGVVARRASSCRRRRLDSRWAVSSRRRACARPTPLRSCCRT